jgi:hypothetical protein
MNRYVVRALVAVLTFCIGVAVSFGPRRSRQKQYDRCHGGGRAFRLDAPPRFHSPSFTGPFLSIDTAQDDPLKLTYSATTTDPTFTQRQHVELLVGNVYGRAINSYTVSYLTALGQYHNGPLVNVFVKSNATPGNLETVSLECDGNETLIVWISSVEFKNGTHWENPRHKIGQSNL